MMFLFGNKGRPALTKSTYSLSDVTTLLGTSKNFLMDAACSGKLRCFVLARSDTFVYTVHSDAVDIKSSFDDFCDMAKAISRGEARDRPIPDKIECRPIYMNNKDIKWLQLSISDCYRILDKTRIPIYVFRLGVMERYGFEDVPPRNGNFGIENRKLGPEGWRLAMYPRDQTPEYIGGTAGYSQPVGLDVSLDDIVFLMSDLNAFIDTLDINKLIANLIINDKFISCDRPSYISKKICFIIDLAEKTWAIPESVDSADEKVTLINDDSVRKALESSGFKGLFGKKRNLGKSKDLIVEWIKPFAARFSKIGCDAEAFTGHLTPEIKVLLAAGKHFWGAPNVCFADSTTHPLQSEIESFMRQHKFTGDYAKYAITLIRPEEAVYAERKSKKQPSSPSMNIDESAC